jgi:membrane-associated phospholipid phosphatase
VVKKSALLLSFLFHPLIVPTLIFIFLMFGPKGVSESHFYNEWGIIFIVFITTFIIPSLSILTMKLTGNISSMHLKYREERIFPFSMVSFFYVISTYLFYLKLEVGIIYILTLAAITICVILLTGITFFWKISAHMVAIAGFLAIVLVIAMKNPNSNLVGLIITGTILSGAIASARLYLNSHDSLEILGGFVLGFSICFSVFYFYI